MVDSDSDPEMKVNRSKSPSSSGSDLDLPRPEAKRARADEEGNDAQDVKQDENPAEPSENTKKSRPARGRKPKEPKLEPEAQPENDENQSPEKETVKAKASRRKSMSVGRKRKNPRASRPATESTSDGAEQPTETPKPSGRPRRASRKLPSSSLTTVAIPSVEAPTVVLASGDNDVGQLGIEKNSVPRFVAVPDVEEKIVSCAAGGMHSLLLSDKGNVFSFGCNDEGSLGRPTEEEEDCFKPARVPFLDAQIARIGAGNIHSIALTTDCRVFIWGSYRDNSGAFGISPENSSFFSEPTELPISERIVDIACGADHTLMLTAEGTVYTMGCAEHGRLGRIKKSHCCRENRRARKMMLSPNPMRVTRKRNRLVSFDAIWASPYCSFTRNIEDGTIWGCGLNNFHQLGEIDSADHDDNFVYQPVELRAFDPSKTWKQICGGEQHTLALDSEGTVYSMGRALYGRLGLGLAQPDDPDVAQLTPVPGLEKPVVAIAAGDHCSFALDTEGQLWSWGQGSNMLGQGDREKASETDIFVPTMCTSKLLKDKRVIHVSAGSNHALCVVNA